MKTKVIMGIFIVLFLVSSGCAQQPNSNGPPVVVARLERHHVYEASIFEDSVSNVLLNGVPQQSYYIRPLHGATVDSAQMELVTPYPDETFPSIEWEPSGAFTVEGPEGGLYSYLWEFGSISEQAGVWIQTDFLEEFLLPFACQRTWNPWITLATVTQTLTLIFEPSEPGGVHIQVRAESTDEASVEILSASSGPLWPSSDFWFDEEDGKLVGANWGGDCVVGTYIFYIEIEVVNEVFPEPICYKPSVGLSLGVDTIPAGSDINDYATILDDVDGDGIISADERITYSATGDYDDWQIIMKDDYDVVLPGCSVGFSEIYTKWEGEASVRSKGVFFSGPAILRVNKEPDTVKLSVEGHDDLWWEIIEYRGGRGAIRLVCIPTSAGGGGGEPGPAPITVTIWSFEDGGLITTSGCVRFTGENPEIEIS